MCGNWGWRQRLRYCMRSTKVVELKDWGPRQLLLFMQSKCLYGDRDCGVGGGDSS